MDQQLYNTSNTQGRGTSLDSLFGQFSSAGLGAPPSSLMDGAGRRGGDSILGAPHQEYQPMEGNYSWTDNYSRFAAPHNFTAIDNLMSELAPEDHFGGGDPHLTSILQQFLMKQQHQIPPQHGMPPSYIPDDLLMNTSASAGNKPAGTGAGGNRSRGGSFHVKLENQQQMAMLEQQQQQQMSHLTSNQHNAQQGGHMQSAQGGQMQQQGHNQGNPGDIYGALELLSAYLNTTPGQFPDANGQYGSQLAGPGSNQQSHLGDPYFDLLNGGGTTQASNPYQYMNPYYPDYLNFDPTHGAATTMKTAASAGGAGTHGPHGSHNTHAAGNKQAGPANAYQQAASHYMNQGHPGGPSGTGYGMDQQVQHELLQQFFKEDQGHHGQHPQHRQYDDLTAQTVGHSQQGNQQNTAVSQQMNKQQRNTNVPPPAGANNKGNKTPLNPSAAVHGHMPPHNPHIIQHHMNPSAAGARMKPEVANMHGAKVPSAATTGKNDNMLPQGPYPPRMGAPGGKPGGMMINDWTDALNSNDYLPESIKSLLPASVRDQLLKKSQEYYEYMRRGPKDPNGGPTGLHHPGLPIPASSTHLLQGFGTNPRNLLGAVGFPSMQPRRIGQLTAEERRNKIEKYLTKRKKRSWSKKISYDCRKRVADSRLRIKGRFVTKEQAVAVLGADDQTNLTDIKEMLVAKFGVTPVPRRRSSGHQQPGEGKTPKSGGNDADKQPESEEAEIQNQEMQELQQHDHDEIADLGPLTGAIVDREEPIQNAVNATEMRPEELDIGDLDKVPLDSHHFDVLDTSKLIVSVTNNVS